MEQKSKIPSLFGEYTVLVDDVGRKYRIGEDPKSISKRLLGYPINRNLILLSAFLAFFSGSVFQYGWSAASKTVISHYGWSLVAAFFVFTVYTVFQSTVTAYIYQRFREKGLISLRRSLLIAAGSMILAYYLFANAFQPWIAYLGYSVIGGLAAGIGYAAGGGMVNKWYPDKRGWRLGIIDGAYGYGAVPFIVLYLYYFQGTYFQEVLYIIGGTIAILTLISSFFAVDPPKNWWPKDVDPILARQAKLKSKELKVNPPAVAHFTPKEMIATRQGKAQFVSFTLALSASLFTTAYYVTFANQMGFKLGIFLLLGSIGFPLANGIGRGFQGLVSNYIGRKEMAALSYAMLGLGSLGVLYAGLAHISWLWAVFAVIAGLAAGSPYTFNWLLVADQFGENSMGKNWSLPYMLKGVGGTFAGLGASIILTLLSGGTLGNVITGVKTITVFAWTVTFWIGAILALSAALIVWFLQKRPTLEDYVKARIKLNEPIQPEIVSNIGEDKLKKITQEVRGR
ncbi:hypothetical protein SUSAZ_05050 [Sulfolobus acidocaldarius SUSAZ]|nr:hypothetical protein SUSAZ_05050 [Sulfolobus acidocaldarius SUSAZ]